MNPSSAPGTDVLIEDSICPTHGWMAHAFIHEAAHAVAAVDRLIRFSNVEILPPHRWESHPSGGALLGGVRMISETPSDWVRPYPIEALEFVMAGVIAEECFFEHSLPGGLDGDVRLWRIGFDALNVVDLSQVEDRLGEAFDSVVSRMRVSTAANKHRIMIVASALAGVDDIRATTSLEFSDDWKLTEEEVSNLIT